MAKMKGCVDKEEMRGDGVHPIQGRGARSGVGGGNI